MNVVISKALLAAASGSRQRYQMDQDQKKSMKVADQQNMKRKADEELTFLKAKKQRLVCGIESLKESADSFADQAEKNGDLTSIAKSNSVRRSATEKKELNIIDSCITAKTLVNKNN